MRIVPPALLLLALVACKVAPEEVLRTSPSASVVAQPTKGAKMESVTGNSADVAALVRDKMASESAHGRKLLVYVGATWCEPCQRFHQEVARGGLDDQLPGVTFLEFDADRDRVGLTGAGYVSQYVPLVVRPSPDGRASDDKVAGVIKGRDPVADLLPRIQGLVNAR